MKSLCWKVLEECGVISGNVLGFTRAEVDADSCGGSPSAWRSLVDEGLVSGLTQSEPRSAWLTVVWLSPWATAMSYMETRLVICCRM